MSDAIEYAPPTNLAWSASATLNVATLPFTDTKSAVTLTVASAPEVKVNFLPVNSSVVNSSEKVTVNSFVVLLIALTDSTVTSGA